MGITEIHLLISILGGSLGLILTTAGVLCLLFYTKPQIDKKLEDLKKDVEEETKKSYEKLDFDIKSLQKTVSEEINEIKRTTAEFKLINEKERSNAKDELHEKLETTRDALEDMMKQFVDTITEVKQADKEMAVQFITLINSLKDELKNDYTARYNDLLVLINTKADKNEFNRLEHKFDKMFETMTELKTTVQIQLDKDKK